MSTNLNHHLRLLGCAISLFACNACAQTNANEQPKSPEIYQKGAAYDCTGVEIKEVDPTTLTKQEQIERLDDSLVDSVDRYSECVSKVQDQMAAAGGGSGTGSASDQANAGSNSTSNKNAEQNAEQSVEAQSKTPKHQGNGASNKLIPPKDNDNIVCSMIWDEITASKDQQQKVGLTKQYKELKCGK